MKIKCFLYAFFIISLNISSIAQKNDLDSIKSNIKNSESFRYNLELFSDVTTISGTKFTDYHSGIKKAYLFNGTFNFAYTLGGENYITGKKRAWFHVLQFSPSAQIRIFQNDPIYGDKSKPVRTPSFYPKINYFLTNKNFWNESRKLFLNIGLGHHSNGQDGTEFVDYTDTVNIYNGSFSESLIGFFSIGGVFEKKIKMFKFTTVPQKDKYRFFRSLEIIKLSWKLGFEYHPVYFSNQKFHQTGLYGGNRVFGNFTILNSKNFFDSKKIVEKNRLSLNFEYITDLTFYSGGYNSKVKIDFFDLKKRLNVNLTYYRRILKSNFPALFAQIAYLGSDNYNIYFQKSIFQARIGLAFGFFEYKKYNIA
jgi:hypothetical protein